MHTCGKSLGAAGALVTASTVLRDFLINRCRPVIFATAPSPLMAITAREALLILQGKLSGNNAWAKLVAFMQREMAMHRLRSPPDSQIVP